MFFHSQATTPPSESPSTLSQNQPGAETRSQHLHIWLIDMIMYKSSTQRIHLANEPIYCHSAISPKHTVTRLYFPRVTHRDLFTCSFYMFNRPLHACNTIKVPTYPCATPHSQAPQSILCIDSRNVLYHPHCTNPLPLIIIIKYHWSRHISLLPKGGYY